MSKSTVCHVEIVNRALKDVEVSKVNIDNTADQFLELLNLIGCTQHVTGSTHSGPGYL